MVAAGRAEVSALDRTTRVPFRAGKLVLWLAPDMALVAAIVAVIYLIAEFGGATALFRDADAGWHIRIGEQILASGTLPHTDPFSFSRAGVAWIPWEWAVDVLSGTLHNKLGLAGVAWFYALAIGASVWMWFRLAWKAGGNFLLVCAFAAPMLSTTNLHWLARPHVFSWLFLLGAVWFCEKVVDLGEIGRRDLAAAFLFAAVWANVHGSFFFAVLLPLIYAAGAWMSGLLSDGQPWNRNARPRAFLNLAVAAAAGTFLNPAGWRLHQHVFAYLTNSALLDRIGEFQSFNFHADGSVQITLALMLAMTGGIAALAIGRADRFLLMVTLTAGALRSARLLPVAALLLLPLAAASITEVLRSAQVSRQARRFLDAFLSYGDRLRVLDRRPHGSALALVLAIALLGVLKTGHPGFPADQFPVAASAQVEQLPAGARIFSSDKFGGYIIYRFAGTRKVFFDGRSDFYGVELLREYAQIIQLRPGWRAQFEAWHFTHALVSPQAPLADALQSAGWHELYRDKVAVLFAREGRS